MSGTKHVSLGEGDILFKNIVEEILGQSKRPEKTPLNFLFSITLFDIEDDVDKSPRLTKSRGKRQEKRPEENTNQLENKIPKWTTLSCLDIGTLDIPGPTT